MSQPRLLMKNLSVEKAHNTQLCLSQKIILEDRLPRQIKTVGGVDVSYVGNLGVGASTVLDYESLELLESQVACCQVEIPYIPTLLSFREIPPAMAAIKKLKIQPDVFLVDAQGLAHPYRCGFASHLGLIIGKPTIGAAKSRLIGEQAEINGQTFLFDKGERIGAVVTTKQDAKPIYVSVGHMVSLETAVRIVKHCAKSRIPEPLLQAHDLATKERIRLARKAR
ncbi:MAG TPA: endonuclease V [Candidatus Limnocylindrales bacterium]|nr:endonuclease V [Candidatus Limnocylindrales bacterium]